MTSMLFCKHGGLITPVFCGQISKNSAVPELPRVTRVSNKLIELLKDYEGENRGEPALSTYQGKSDKLGVHTIGWGHAMEGKSVFRFSDGTEKDLYPEGTNIEEWQAEEILAKDIYEYETKLNGFLEGYGIGYKVNQRFYDALFDLLYNVGEEAVFDDTDMSVFLDEQNFDLSNTLEVMYQFGDYTDELNFGIMCRRLDELDIIFDGTYDRQYDIRRYGDIFTKKSAPNS